MDYYVHPSGICDSRDVGHGTRIWAFAHVLAGARIGDECNICDHTFVEHDVVIGNRVTVKCGVQLYDGVRVEDDVFIGPNASFTNDRFPRSKQYPEKFLLTTVCKGASIGANATILAGLTIGQHAMVGAGAVVTRSVPPKAIVTGNPARIIGYVDSRTRTKAPPDVVNTSLKEGRVQRGRVQGVSVHILPLVTDMRGNLTVGDFLADVPFVPKRYFMVFDVPSEEVRGEHAHRTCHQFLVCARGRCSIVADDGTAREEYELDRPNIGIYVPPMVWARQEKYSSDAVLLVFASERYDPADYVRSYEEFRSLLGGRP